MLRCARRLICETKGAVMVETALAFGLCFFMLIWMGEFCFTLYCQSILQQAAVAGAEYASTHGAIANKMSGGGSGFGLADPSGDNIANVVAASMAQFALKRSLPKFSVCPVWWINGSERGGFSPSQCSPSGNSLSPYLGVAHYGSPVRANPGSVVTVQAVWTYVPYIPVPWSTTLSYTATAVVVW